MTATARQFVSPPSKVRISNPARLGRLIAVAVGLAALFMIPWTVFLGYTLPRRYDARHWSLLWIGFDVILCAVLTAFAWLTWKRRQLMLVMAIIAGTLLFCDAWFDVITSWGNRDHWVTVITALVGRATSGRLHVLAGLSSHPAVIGGVLRDYRTGRPSPGLLRAPALYLPTETDPTEDALTPEDPCAPGRFSQARAGVRSITNELHGALDGLSFNSNDSAVDRSGIERARRAIEHALSEIEAG